MYYKYIIKIEVKLAEKFVKKKKKNEREKTLQNTHSDYLLRLDTRAFSHKLTYGAITYLVSCNQTSPPGVWLNETKTYYTTLRCVIGYHVIAKHVHRS